MLGATSETVANMNPGRAFSPLVLSLVALSATALIGAATWWYASDALLARKRKKRRKRARHAQAIRLGLSSPLADTHNGGRIGGSGTSRDGGADGDGSTPRSATGSCSSPASSSDGDGGGDNSNSSSGEAQHTPGSGLFNILTKPQTPVPSIFSDIHAAPDEAGSTAAAGWQVIQRQQQQQQQQQQEKGSPTYVQQTDAVRRSGEADRTVYTPCAFSKSTGAAPRTR